MTSGELYQIGDAILGRWAVLDVLGGHGKTGMGVVYVVRDLLTSSPLLAAKTLQRGKSTDRSIRDLLRREADLWVRLGVHPNIVTAHYVYMVGDQLYVFMEYIEGTPEYSSLRQLLERRKLTHPEAAELTDSICAAMIHASSRGLGCHRDLKPDNILIDLEGRYRLTDFGVALYGVELTSNQGDNLPTSIPALHEQGLAGTPGYLAPELIEGAPYDPSCDVYAFGLILHQALTGSLRPPLTAEWGGDLFAYEAANARIRRTTAPPQTGSPLDSIIEACLSYDKHLRPKGFKEVRSLLWRTAGELVPRTALLPKTGRDADEDTAFDNVFSLWSLATEETEPNRRRRKLENALAIATEAVQLKPGRYDLLDLKGIVLVEMGRLDEAIASFDEAIRLAPTFPWPHNNKGRALRSRGDNIGALDCYKRAASLAPDQSLPWTNTGNTLRDLGRSDEACKAYRRSLEIDKKQQYVWLQLSIVEERIRGKACALDALHEALIELPGDSAISERIQSLNT